MSQTNLYYAQKFFDVETLQTRNSDALDFSNVYIGTVLRFITEIAQEKNIVLTDDQIKNLIHSNLWDESEGNTIVNNSDSLDFHDVSISSIDSFIKAVRAL
jgi:hypothetical protein